MAFQEELFKRTMTKEGYAYEPICVEIERVKVVTIGGKIYSKEELEQILETYSHHHVRKRSKWEKLVRKIIG